MGIRNFMLSLTHLKDSLSIISKEERYSGKAALAERNTCNTSSYRWHPENSGNGSKTFEQRAIARDNMVSTCYSLDMIKNNSATGSSL